MTDEWVRFGVVARAHGIRGALKVKLDNDDSDTLQPGLEVRLAVDLTAAERVSSHRVGRYASGILVLEGVDDKDRADALKSRVLFVRRQDFPEPDDLFFVDLIGAPVVHESGAPLGKIASITDNGAQPLLVVVDGKREVLVPFVDAIVIEASRERVVLRPPGGLFDDDAVLDTPADGAADGVSDASDES